MFRQWTDCSECHHTGIVVTEDGDEMTCYDCKGSGRRLEWVDDTEPSAHDLEVADWETFGDWRYDELKCGER